MATEKQLDYFKHLYDEEYKRVSSLEDNAKSNIGFATFYTAFVAFTADKLQPFDFASKMLFFISILFLVLSFLLSLFATRVLGYEISRSPEEALDEMSKDVVPTNEDFFDARIVDYAIAAETNAKINNSKARFLNWARYMLLVGITSNSCYIAYLILERASK